jgi:hypothetical protein
VGSDLDGVRSVATDAGTVRGGSEGLYGTRAAAPCDREALIAKLTGDPKTADAWASARGIRSEQIADDVRQTTPAHLRSDTYVTDYRYENGRATPHPAVLQAGSAVLIDRRGVPVTRCASGDPLGQPSRYDKEPRVQGKQWDGFRPAAVWVIEPASDDVPGFVMVDIDRHRGGNDDRVITYLQVGRGGVYVARPLPPGHPVPPTIPVEGRRPWPGGSDDRDPHPAQRDWQQPQNGQQPVPDAQQPAQNGQQPVPDAHHTGPNNQRLSNGQPSQEGPSQNGPQPANANPDQTGQVPHNQGGQPMQQEQAGQPGQGPAPSAVAPRPH